MENQLGQDSLLFAWLYHKLPQISEVYRAEQYSLQASPSFGVTYLRVADESARKVKFL